MRPPPFAPAPETEETPELLTPVYDPNIVPWKLVKVMSAEQQAELVKAMPPPPKPGG
jgi:hypothetical protein